MANKKKSRKTQSGSSGSRSADDPVTDYAERVLSGEIVAGTLVRLACERHLRDLKTAAKRGLRWNLDEAKRVFQVFASLRQSKGRWADQPLTLLPWQRFVIGSVFGWQRADTGLRRFKTSYTEIARKCGKSTLAAGVGIVLTDFDGEAGAEVYSAATKRDQAKIVWSEAARMARRSGFTPRLEIIPSRANMHCEETGSKFEALGADANSLDGLNVHGAIVDELHAHRTREVVDVLETASGARLQPLFFYITTAGLMGDATIYSEMHNYARRVVEGVTEDDEWFVYVATLDEGDDWTDLSVYEKANPSLGETVMLEDLRKERDRAMETPGRQNAFRRLRLNQQTQQVTRWLDLAKWDACPSIVVPEEFAGRECFGGLDLATTTDIAAFALVFPDGETEEGAGLYTVLPFFWVPEESARQRSRRDRVDYLTWIEQGFIEATGGDVIDYRVIRERIGELGERYMIREIGFDPWNATQLATQLGEEDGFQMVQVRQGFVSLTEPTKELERLVIGGRLNHGRNPVLRWMVGNVAVEQDPAGNLKPSKKRSTEKIDGVVALVMALSRAIVSTSGSSVYDERGLVAI